MPPGRGVTFTKLHRGSALHIQPSHKYDYAPTAVEHPLLSTALRHLLLLLLFDFGGLRLDLAGTGERSVNYRIIVGEQQGTKIVSDDE